MFRPIDFQNQPFLAKTINIRQGIENRLGDFWNSFLAGLTKQHGVIDPLAHLHLRMGPRDAHIVQTHGMMPVVEQPGQFRWESRALVENPNEAERAFRPVVHAEPMYTPEQKELFSKPQSTTLIYAARNIRPELFVSQRGPRYLGLSGVLIPANDDYALLNRIMRYDRGTIGRPYDHAELAQRQIFNSLDELYAAPDLQGPRARYTEILARLRWYNPAQALDNPMKSAILIYYDPDHKTTYESILVSLSRALDLRFALFRKFGIRQNIPLVIYRHDAAESQNILNGFFELGDDEDVPEFINNILITIHPSARINYLVSTHNFYTSKMLILQQGIYQLLTGQRPSNPGFENVLLGPRSGGCEYLFPYLETVRALVIAIAQRRMDSTAWHSSWQRFIAPFFSGPEEESENVYISYGFDADFGSLSERERVAKVNIRFFPLTHPLRETALLSRFFDAIEHSNIGDVQTILGMPGFDVNQKFRGKTPLIWACSHPGRSPEIVNRLLAIPDIDVNQRDFLGNTALMLAWTHHLVLMVDMLLAKPGINLVGVDPNHRGTNGNTLLISACALGNIDMATRLLRIPYTDIPQWNDAGMTALDFILNNTQAEFQAAGTPAIVKSFLIYYRDHRRLFRIGTLERLSIAWKSSKERMCILCAGSTDKPFSIFKPRHHCRGCGEAVCAGHSREIRVSTGDSIRYCTICAAIVSTPL